MFNFINKKSFVITPPGFFALLFAIAFGANFIRLSAGDVMNHYPSISPDGFDWYTEGIYLIKLIQGQDLPPLPVLRPPIFVLTCALDYLVGSAGVFLGFAYAISIYLTAHFSSSILEVCHPAASKNGYWNWILVIGLTALPVNFFKVYLLSDSLAMTFALISVTHLMRYVINNGRESIGKAAYIAVIGGLTQAYALIPFLLGCFVILISRSKRGMMGPIIFAMILVASSFLFLTVGWRTVIPHIGTPENFTLLKISFGMLSYYAKVWSFYLWPFIIAACLIVRGGNIQAMNRLPVAILLINIFVFSSLCFFYQWPESRFSYYFWPWFIVLVAVVGIGCSRGAFYFMLVMVVMSAVIAPKNYWSPSFSSKNFEVSRNWINQYVRSTPVDRGLSRNVDPGGRRELFLTNADNYTRGTIEMYLLLGRY